MPDLHALGISTLLKHSAAAVNTFTTYTYLYRCHSSSIYALQKEAESHALATLKHSVCKFISICSVLFVPTLAINDTRFVYGISWGFMCVVVCDMVTLGNVLQ